MKKTKKIIAIGLIITGSCLGLFLYLKPGTEKNEGKILPLTTADQPATINKSLITEEPAMPKGFKTNTNWRDPFAVPTEIFAAQNKDALSVETKMTISVDQPDFQGSKDSGENLPTLIGIISSGSQKAVIIRDKDGSKIYKINDQLGEYELTQIREKSVILESKSSEGIRELLLKR